MCRETYHVNATEIGTACCSGYVIIGLLPRVIYVICNKISYFMRHVQVGHQPCPTGLMFDTDPGMVGRLQAVCGARQGEVECRGGQCWVGKGLGQVAQ